MTVRALHREPVAVAAERVFLGTVIAGSPAAAVELPTLDVDDFCDPRTRVTAEVLLRRQERGDPLEPVLVLRELLAGGHSARWPDGTGPGPWLFDTLSLACPDCNAPYYAASIREDSARRRLQEAGTRLVQAAQVESLESVKLLVADELAAVCAALNRVVG